MNAIEYCKNLEAHKLATCYFNPLLKSPFITYKGKMYTFQQFDKAFPINHIKIEPTPSFLKGRNPDQTKQWLKH